jgi:hypothetical protein
VASRVPSATREQEEKGYAEDPREFSDLTVIAQVAKKGRGNPKIIKLKNSTTT